MSQVRTNSIVPVGGIPAGASGGGIIQCVAASITGDGTTTTSTTFVDTGLSASITPRSSSNKILCIWTIGIRNDTQRSGIALVRGSTSIFAATESKGIFVGPHYISYHFLDSPATTSSTTYKIQYVTNPSGTSSLNDTGSNHVGDRHRLILIEVSG